MRGGDDRPQARLVDGDGREDDGLGEDAFLDESIAEAASGVGVAHHHRRDRRLGGARVEAEPGQFDLEVAGVHPETFLEFGLVAHDPDRLAAGLHHGGRMRGREEERARALGQDLAEGLGPRHVPAERADGLGERPDLDCDAAVEAEMVDRTASVAAQDTARVGVVDHDGRTERLGRLDDPGEWRDIAIHREDPVRHDQDQPPLPAPGPAVLPGLAEDLAQGLDVGMRVDLARCLGEPHPVDDRGVVERVGDDQVGLAGDRRDDAGVRGEARLEGQDRGRFLELGELRLQRLVHRHRPGDRSNGPTPRPELANRRLRRRNDAGVVGQAQVIVR